MLSVLGVMGRRLDYLPLDALSHARKAVAMWTALPEYAPEVAMIVTAFEQAAMPLAQTLRTGYGSVEVVVRNKRLDSVKWHQGVFFS